MPTGASSRMTFRSDGTPQWATAPSADPQTERQNPPPSTEQQGVAPTPPAQESRRLTVNPVTGLVTMSASDYSPLTARERLKVYWKGTYFSYGAYFKPVFFALVLDQATGSPKQWGGGFAGFGRRVASRTASNMLQGTIRAPLAAALHEDVRFVYSDQHGAARRTWHAIVYSFLTYNDQGAPTLNIAKFVGYYSSTAISTVWHPPSKNSLLHYTFYNGSEQLGLSVPINILQEYWPNLIHTFRRRQVKQGSAE
jgi:hypothetical protein